MKIAVSSRGQSLQDQLEERFGRCAGFVVYDTKTKTGSFLDNSRQQDQGQGAGIQTLQMLSAAGIDVLITGQLGPNAVQAMNQTQIQAFSSSTDTVQEAIEAWQRNELQHISSPSGQPGAGRGMGGGGGKRGRGPAQGGRGMGGGARGRGPEQGGQG